jgi:signal transduction histidine kinase/DNA-binding NarL/FixJ family response regulator
MSDSDAARAAALLDAVLETVPAGVFIVDLKSGRALRQNAEGARLLGEEPVAGVLRASPLRVTTADGGCYPPGERPTARAALHGDRVRGELVRYRRRDGTEAFLEVNSAPVADGEGYRFAVVTTLLDVTGRRADRRHAAEQSAELEREQAARAAAESATRAREEILGVVAHDLRNPISAIRMYAHLLRERLSGEDAAAFAAGIDELTLQADRLIQDLLDVSSVEAGRLRMAIRAADPATLLERARETLEPLATQRGLLLQCSVAPGTPAVRADPDRLVQVLGNLGGNALKFTPAGGRVTLSATAEETHVVFSVRDTGPGIAEDHQALIFQSFWQAPVGVDGTVGVGLGLAIAKGIVEQHGGSIWVESQPGDGADFRFTLPLAADGSGAERPKRNVEAPAKQALPPAEPIRVLMVDDHPAIRRGVEEILRRTPLVELVGEAASGEQALEMLGPLRPHVVLMDLEMPGLGGLEAIRQARGRFPAIRVLALTADAPEHGLVPVLQAGGSGFVRKCDAHRDLLNAIQEVAEGRLVVPRGSEHLLVDAAHTRDALADDPAFRSLDERDRRILALSAEGYTSAEIGRRVFLSKTTVDGYRSRLMRRLGLRHRSELTRWALRHGLLAPEPEPSSGSPDSPPDETP